MAVPVVYEAAKIANAYVRPTSDRLAQTYNLCRAMLKLAAAEDWMGIFSQFNEKDPFLDPDRPNDERHPITPEDIKAIIAGMQTFVDFFESSGLADVIFKTAVVPVIF